MNLRDISVLKMSEPVYHFYMKTCLWIIAATFAISTSLLAATDSIAPSLINDKQGSSEYLAASISKMALGATQTGDNTGSTPYMNRPGGSYAQFSEVPGVPDGGLTALLLVLGMAGLVLLARRDSVIGRQQLPIQTKK